MRVLAAMVTGEAWECDLDSSTYRSVSWDGHEAWLTSSEVKDLRFLMCGQGIDNINIVEKD